MLRPSAPSDRPALLRLFREAFGSDASPAEWEWKYDRAPHRAVSVGAFEGARALGYFGGLGTRFRGASGDLPGLSAVDVMTAPSARALGRRTLFQELGETFFRLNGEAGAPFVLGFPNDRHRRAGERTLSYLSIEPAAQWERPAARPGLVRGLRRRFRRIVRGAGLSP
ncbi:MAG TPA: GNAT family N-acetyltransferase, partial [Thermoanaerobaculia bacterium]|nr:GNAT family N-acetyltransferase [Thermoanaerobaculia bacterium]